RVHEERRRAGHLLSSRAGRRDDRGAVGHGLEDGKAEALREAWVDDELGTLVQGTELVRRDEAERADPIADAGVSRVSLPPGRAGEHELHLAVVQATNGLQQAWQVLPRFPRAAEQAVGPGDPVPLPPG